MSKFQNGNRYGKGRPLGSRNKATLLLEAVSHDTMAKGLEALARKAEKGDLPALKLLLPLWLRQAADFVKIDLPKVVDAASLAEAQAVLLAQVADEEVSLEQAGRLSGMLENRRRALETADIERLLRQTQENFAERDRRAGTGNKPTPALP